MSTATTHEPTRNGHSVPTVAEAVTEAADPAPPPAPTGLHFERSFAHLPEPEWNYRDVEIRDDNGKVIFVQEGIFAPATWSDLAVRVTASKYFYGKPGSPEREGSVRDLITRVAVTIYDWGLADGYFDSRASADAFYLDLRALLEHQHGAFNSPVWFNVGLSHVYGIEGRAENWRWDNERGEAVACDDALKHPQISACFIQSVADNMGSILDLAKSEGMLFKYGSGSGTDLSTLRSSLEPLSGGGTPSGPLSFMRVYDAGASVIQSGGRVRRAAKMQTLKVGHPDIRRFIAAKPAEDRKARALMREGYSPDEAYRSVLFQNCNMSVRATDLFLRAAEAGTSSTWLTTGVLGGEYDSGASPSSILDEIAEGTWACGDPGMQYEDTIQAWHTCPNTEPINSSNPCSEYMFINDNSCNLSSVNLLKFRCPDGSFDLPRFRAACRIFIVAQEILVDRASYPTAKIAANSHRFRTLGLGFANLGGYLMTSGLPYDSDEGRSLAGAITACMTGQAYLTSAELAEHRGAFEGYATNGKPMLGVIQKHRKAVNAGFLASSGRTTDLWMEASDLWDNVAILGQAYGYRNAQVSVLAPTGTIAFTMDCDTTGVEPDFALVKRKSLAGGGSFEIRNRSIRAGLKHFVVNQSDFIAAVDWLETKGTLKGFDQAIGGGYFDSHPDAERRLAVFDCASPDPGYGRSISAQGHLQMMAAVQPFLSGAISKTINLPAEATVADIRQVYLDAWHLGLKAVAIYRDGSKGAQPLTAIKMPETPATPTAPSLVATSTPTRRRLPATRHSLTHKFTISGHEGYLTVGLFADGTPGEVFVRMAKEGSTVSGLLDAWATMVSIALQSGVALADIVGKFAGSRYLPEGFTAGNPDIPYARSLTDYIARWLGMEFLPGYRAEHAPHRVAAEVHALEPMPSVVEVVAPPGGRVHSDCPPCSVCGCLTRRNGTCHLCDNCGTSQGCS